MSFFFTQHRIEDLLTRETRVIPGPAGVPVSIDAFKAWWKAYDFLIFFGVHSAERLAALAEQNARLMGLDFGNSLGAVVWDANKSAREILGIDCFAVRPRKKRNQ